MSLVSPDWASSPESLRRLAKNPVVTTLGIQRLGRYRRLEGQERPERIEASSQQGLLPSLSLEEGPSQRKTLLWLVNRVRPALGAESELNLCEPAFGNG